MGELISLFLTNELVYIGSFSLIVLIILKLISRSENSIKKRNIIIIIVIGFILSAVINLLVSKLLVSKLLTPSNLYISERQAQATLPVLQILSLVIHCATPFVLYHLVKERYILYSESDEGKKEAHDTAVSEVIAYADSLPDAHWCVVGKDIPSGDICIVRLSSPAVVRVKTADRAYHFELNKKTDYIVLSDGDKIQFINCKPKKGSDSVAPVIFSGGEAK